VAVWVSQEDRPSVTPQSRRRTAHLAALTPLVDQAIDRYFEQDSSGDEVTLAVLAAVGAARLKAAAPSVHPDRRKQDLGLLVAQVLVDKFGSRRVLTLRGDDRRTGSTRRNTWEELPWVNRFTPHQVLPVSSRPVPRIVLDSVVVRKIVLGDPAALSIDALERLRGEHPVSLADSALAELGHRLIKRQIPARTWIRRVDRLDRILDPSLPIVPGGWELAAFCALRPIVGFDEPTMRRSYRAAWEHLKGASNAADLERPCVFELADGRRLRYEFCFDRTPVRPGLDEPGDRWRAWSRSLGTTIRTLHPGGHSLSAGDIRKLTAGFLLMDLSEDAVLKLDLFVRIISKRAFDAARKRETYTAQRRSDSLELNLLFGLSLPMVICMHDRVVHALARATGSPDAWRLMTPAELLRWLEPSGTRSGAERPSDREPAERPA